MDMWEFKKWRRALGVSQFEAAEKLGVSRGAIQKWECERFPIPHAVVLACDELARQLRRDSKFGPVLLFYADEPLWPEPDCRSRVLCLVREPHPTNEAAIDRACRLRQAPDFISAFVVDADGNMIWSNSELLHECEKRALAPVAIAP